MQYVPRCETHEADIRFQSGQAVSSTNCFQTEQTKSVGEPISKNSVGIFKNDRYSFRPDLLMISGASCLTLHNSPKEPA